MEMETKNKHLTENDMLQCYVNIILLQAVFFWNLSEQELRWTYNQMYAECCI
jgi:hypothetical protein